MIYNGRVHESSKWIDQELMVGNILGVQHLLPEFSLALTTTAIALTVVQTAFIPRSILKDKYFLRICIKKQLKRLFCGINKN